jgi:hypothetical protein
MARHLVLMTALLLSATAGTAAADDMTVQSLLNQGYTVASVLSSPVGPGIFLQNGHALVLCFVREKPDTPTLETFYCKPVK